ncbi:MAG: hypothetical protein ED557_11945 [Balneola sp.]|nr:MAG: hypothetical protein ED557_11945 [Balneola sp.]
MLVAPLAMIVSLPVAVKFTSGVGANSLHNSGDGGFYFYHYTDQAGFNAIMASGTIIAGNKGRVYMTPAALART